jgi:uncharacterized FAD-dependent dehydrogenase
MCYIVTSVSYNKILNIKKTNIKYIKKKGDGDGISESVQVVQAAEAGIHKIGALATKPCLC